MRKISIKEAMDKAKALEQSDQPTQAMELYKLILTSFPRNDQAKQRLKTLQEANLKLSSQFPSEENFNQLIYRYNHGEYHEVVVQTLELVKKYPKDFLIWNLLGAAYSSLKDIDNAADSFKKVTQLNPDYPDGYNNLGVALNSQGKQKEAVEVYKKAVEINPEYAEAHYNMGNAFAESRKFDDALESYTKVISLKPNHARAYNNWGVSLKEMGQLNQFIILDRRPTCQSLTLK